MSRENVQGKCPRKCWGNVLWEMSRKNVEGNVREENVRIPFIEFCRSQQRSSLILLLLFLQAWINPPPAGGQPLLLFLQAWINPPLAGGQPLGSSASTCLFLRCHLVSGWEISGPLQSCPSISSFSFLGCEVPVLLTSLFFWCCYLLITPHVRTTSVWPPVFCLFLILLHCKENRPSFWSLSANGILAGT